MDAGALMQKSVSLSWHGLAFGLTSNHANGAALFLFSH